MSESSALLHNMSTPPKTVLKYSGLPNPAFQDRSANAQPAVFRAPPGL